MLNDIETNKMDSLLDALNESIFANIPNPYFDEEDIDSLKDIIESNYDEIILSSEVDGKVVYGTPLSLCESNSLTENMGRFINMYDKFNTPIFTGDLVAVIDNDYLTSENIETYKGKNIHNEINGIDSLEAIRIRKAYEAYYALPDDERDYVISLPYVKEFDNVLFYPESAWLESDDNYYEGVTQPEEVVVVRRGVMRDISNE